MIEGKITHLVINYIIVEEELVLVGATDNERWRWDKEEGMSGVDAKTIVGVTLTGKLNSGLAIKEEADFSCSPGDPTRTLAMSHIEELFSIAWEIKNCALDMNSARKKYFGFEIK